MCKADRKVRIGSHLPDRPSMPWMNLVHVSTFSNISIPKVIEELEEELKVVEQMKNDAVKAQKYELAASYRDKQRQLCWHWRPKNNAGRRDQGKTEIVDEEKIAEVVAMISGVPVQRIAQAEGQRLLEMRNELKAQVIGQDEAVDKIVKAIQRNRVGLKDPNKPIGTFMFLGPTGVGKTHLAKKLAELLFDSHENLIRIDMSEYMEKFNVSRLVGAPPGYVGYEEGGQLTEKVRRRPYSVVLLDEIEKAHPDVFNILLQILDEGHVTDSLGRKIDFKNTILIMTSNIGTRQLKDFGRGIGFSTNNDVTDAEYSRSVIQKALNKAFAPEFLNRVDDIVMFDQLGKDSIFKIIDLELNGLFKRIGELGYKVELLRSQGVPCREGIRRAIRSPAAQTCHPEVRGRRNGRNDASDWDQGGCNRSGRFQQGTTENRDKNCRPCCELIFGRSDHSSGSRKKPLPAPRFFHPSQWFA